jgi:hypothetical protein
MMQRVLWILQPTAFLALMLAVLASGLSAAGEVSSRGWSTIDRPAISRAMSELTQGKQYKYTESALEDPVWVRWFRNWYQRLVERWSQGPGLAGVGSGTVILISIAAVSVIFLIAFLVIGFLNRRVDFGMRIPGELAGLDGHLTGAWGEAGVAGALQTAASGNLREGISMLFRSLLRGLDNSGWISYQKGKASRAYLRQIRRSDTLYPLFRDFLLRFELAYYRELAPSQEDWHFLYDTYGRVAKLAGETPAPSYMRKR